MQVFIVMHETMNAGCDVHSVFKIESDAKDRAIELNSILEKTTGRYIVETHTVHQ